MGGRSDEPFPWRLALTLAWCQLTSAFSFAVLFPFVPFLIVDLGLVADIRQPGLYSGLLISASQLGKILTAYHWGRWSDRHGRKKTILIGLLGISSGMVLFGLTAHFWQACLARFLCGALDNIFGGAKTLLSELVEPQHQAKGMAILGSAWGFALIFGPAVGGWLSQPALKYPAVFDPEGVFGRWPYLLPCCFTASMALVACILLHHVPETVGRAAAAKSKAKGDGGEEEGEERETLLSDKAGSEGPADVGAARHFLLDPKPRLAITLSLVVSCFVISDDDVMPLWGAAPRSAGGLGLSTNEIGMMLGLIGVVLLVMFALFAPVDKLLGTLDAFRASTLIFIPTVAATPWAADFEGRGMWTCLLTVGAVKATAMEFVIIALGMLVNNSAPSSRRGAVNGAAEVAGGVGRLIAPSLSSPLFAWSVTNGHGFPLNRYLVFLVNAALGSVALMVASRMPKSIARPPDEG